MSLDVKFRPLYGAHTDGPLSYLLQIQNFTILLDCGWDPPYDAATLQPILDVLTSIDAVLLSHPDTTHMGALPFLVGKAKLDAPVYATGAIHRMAQMVLYNEYLINHAASDFSAFDLDDVDMAFSRMHQLRYRQEVVLVIDHPTVDDTSPATHISITPLPAGRLLGSTIWKITVGGEDFVYAVDINHRRERHLIGAPLESAFHRPALLIADAASLGRVNAPYHHQHTAAAADKNRSERSLLDAMMFTLRSEGSVLIPVDAAGRVLELLLLLEGYWAEHRLPYPLVFVGPMVHTTLEFARSQLEWMNETLSKAFGHSRDNPFALRHVTLCASLGEVRSLPPGPKVVLAVDASMVAGPSKQLLVEWAPDPRNLVVVALEPLRGSLAERLLGAAAQQHQQQQSTQTNILSGVGVGGTGGPIDPRTGLPVGAPPPPLLHISLSKRVALKGEELEKYLEEEQARRDADASGALLIDEEMMIVDNGGGGGVGGGSPRSVASAGKSSLHSHISLHQASTTRANVASIGHAPRDATVAGGVGVGGDMLGGGVGVGDGGGAPTPLNLNFGAPSHRNIKDSVQGNIMAMNLDLEETEGATIQCLIEGFEVKDGAAGPLFPGEDEWENTTYDEYGATVDASQFEVGGGTVLGQALASEAEAERGGVGGIGPGQEARGEGDEDTIEAQIPTKIIYKEMHVPLLAKVLRLDFNGTSDAKSIQMMLTHVAPRVAILIHANEEATNTLANKLAAELEGLHTSVLTPGVGEDVDVEVGPCFEVLLTEELMRGVGLHAVSGYELAWVNGRVEQKKKNVVVEGGGGEESGEGDGDGMRVLIPATDADTTTATAMQEQYQNDDEGNVTAATNALSSYGGVFIGDVRLSELRKALNAAGVRAEFHAGALYCAGQVVVKRREEGGLVLEGAGGDAFYKIRDIVYGQYHIC